MMKIRFFFPHSLGGKAYGAVESQGPGIPLIQLLLQMMTVLAVELVPPAPNPYHALSFASLELPSPNWFIFSFTLLKSPLTDMWVFYAMNTHSK